MAYVQQLFQKNFLEYASYVIKDRAIPHLDDGLKPVQRRILHSLFEMDDGKFHKVANVVGHCMKYHPHGDASIYEALVVLASKGLFLDTQGNFGNIFTGDPASAARYIETRVLAFARDVLYKPEITPFEDSYDGRNKEPILFPAKIPVVLFLGAEGIAVGMSTKILPHNLVEVLSALKAELRGEPFQLFPDFPTAGIIDASAYQDGLGKVLVRAKLDTSDAKRIVIRELPYGQTTESLIESIENAAKRGKLKIAGIQDFTTEHVEIEIMLARGVYSQDTVDALYAFTDCETSISCNLLVIGPDNRPVTMTVSEVVRYHAKKLLQILKAELELDLQKLRDKLHARTLERIFIEERIYKSIEDKKTAEAVATAVKDGFIPFAKELQRPVSDDDVEMLLKIPIRRISLYDINKARKEVAEIEAAIKQILHHLAHLTDYAIATLDGYLAKEGAKWQRKTSIASFSKVDVREVASRNLVVRYDQSTGYVGWNHGKAELGDVLPSPFLEPGAGIWEGKGSLAISEFDRILLVKTDGSYSVTPPSEKLFVDKKLLGCFLADKETLPNRIFTLVYRTAEGEHYIKRFKVEQFILDRAYITVPEGGTFVAMTIADNARFKLNYVKKPGLRVLEEEFAAADYLVKGMGAQGNRLSQKPVAKVTVLFPKVK